MEVILSVSGVASGGCCANEIPFRYSGEWLASLAFRLKIIYRKNVALPAPERLGASTGATVMERQVLALVSNSSHSGPQGNK
jgi:hypothetical protein